MFILCSVRIPTSYGLPLAMIDVWKYILSSENNFRRQLLLDFVVRRPEIFKNTIQYVNAVYHRISFDSCVWVRLGIDAGDLKIPCRWMTKSSKSCLRNVFSLDKIYFQTSTITMCMPYDVGIRAEQKINIIC